MPSAETMGNVYSRMDAGTVREAIHQVYGGLKRNKALPDNRGIPVAIVDGHESLQAVAAIVRGVWNGPCHSERKDRIQYYHRQVTLLLVTGAPPGRPPLRLPLDPEPQLPKEAEVATAMRLLERVPRSSTSCSNTANMFWSCSRMNAGISVRMPSGCSLRCRQSREDPVIACGGTLAAWFPGRR